MIASIRARKKTIITRKSERGQRVSARRWFNVTELQEVNIISIRLPCRAPIRVSCCLIRVCSLLDCVRLATNTDAYRSYARCRHTCAGKHAKKNTCTYNRRPTADELARKKITRAVSTNYTGCLGIRRKSMITSGIKFLLNLKYIFWQIWSIFFLNKGFSFIINEFTSWKSLISFKPNSILFTRR